MFLFIQYLCLVYFKQILYIYFTTIFKNQMDWDIENFWARNVHSFCLQLSVFSRYWGRTALWRCVSYCCRETWVSDVNTRHPPPVGLPPTLAPRCVSTATREAATGAFTAPRAQLSTPWRPWAFSVPSRAIPCIIRGTGFCIQPISICSASNATCYEHLGVGNARELCLQPPCQLSAASDAFQGGLCVGRLSCCFGNKPHFAQTLLCSWPCCRSDLFFPAVPLTPFRLASHQVYWNITDIKHCVSF